MSDDGVRAWHEPASDCAPQWLSADELEAWKAVISLLLLLPGALDAQLQRDAGLNMFEYAVLSALSMADGRVLRMSELAELASGSLSRLSNVVTRLERRGLVRRIPDPVDGRCTDAVLTDQGWDLVVRAAPGHAAAVRQLVLDPLTDAQVRNLGEAGQQIIRQLRRCPAPRADAMGPPGRQRTE
jgi:DNA-binding MarR family transcriptional regulator